MEELEERKQIRQEEQESARIGQEERRNASGSVRKHEVCRRAPREQEGPGFLAALALLSCPIHRSAQGEFSEVRLQEIPHTPL